MPNRNSGVCPTFFTYVCFLVLHFLLYINDLLDDVICNTAIYAVDTIYYKCDQASDLWQQLELASKLESNLWDFGMGQEMAY